MWLETSSQRPEALAPAPRGKGGSRLGRGLRHPPACPADSGRAHEAAPTPYNQPDSCKITIGSPELQRLDPPEGITHLRRRLPARAQLCPLQTRAGASPATSNRGRGQLPLSTNQEWPPGARGQSMPLLNEPGRSYGNIPEGSLRLVRLFPTPPRCSAVDLPAPPKPRRAIPPQDRGGGS